MKYNKKSFVVAFFTLRSFPSIGKWLSKFIVFSQLFLNIQTKLTHDRDYSYAIIAFIIFICIYRMLNIDIKV